MSKLITAILKGDIEAVRSLTRTEPDLLSVPSVAGTMPLRLARDKGRVDMQVALIRATAPGSEYEEDYPALLNGYIEEISHNYACAGWLDGIEYNLWQLASTNIPLTEGPFGLEYIGKDELSDLQYLSDKCRGWVMYAEGGPRIVRLEEWLKQFGQWQRGCV